ncbi:MAG: response regulator transcription factor [Bacteroidales bacterium]
MEKLRIFLVDDHKLFREGLKLLLLNLDCISEVFEAHNGIEFLNALPDVNPDIVFMDIEMPEMDGIQTTEKALDMFPETKIIALSMYGDEVYYSRMIEAGVKGFLFKDSEIQEVENAIHQVASGKSYFSHEIMINILQNTSKKKPVSKLTDLSEREKEVLMHICNGLSNHEIAEALNLSKRTVDKHRENILLKTNSNNTASLVIFAIKNGIIEI